MLRSIGQASILALLIAPLWAEPARSNQESPSTAASGKAKGAAPRDGEDQAARQYLFDDLSSWAGIEGARSEGKEKMTTNAQGKKNQKWKQKKMERHPRSGHGTGGAGGAGDTPDQPREQDRLGSAQDPEHRDVHEPGTAALLVAGVMGLASLRRRRTR